MYASPKFVKDATIECEKLGIDSMWVHDHIAYGPDHLRNCWQTGMREQMKDGTTPYYYDSLMTLVYAAGFTEHMKLGDGLVVLPVRNVLATARAR